MTTQEALLKAIGHSLLIRCPVCHGNVEYLTWDFTKAEAEKSRVNVCDACKKLSAAVAAIGG